MGNIEIFDSIADHYDSPARAAVNDAMLAVLDGLVRPDDHLLDFGCGTGLIGFGALNSVEHVTFCDPSDAMLRQVQSKLEQLPESVATKASLISTNIEVSGQHFPEKYSLVVAAQVLLHMADTESALRGLAGAVKPGGRLVIFDFLATPEVSHPTVHSGFDPDSLETLAKKCGLIVHKWAPVFSSENLLMGKPSTLFVMEFCAAE